MPHIKRTVLNLAVAAALLPNSGLLLAAPAADNDQTATTLDSVEVSSVSVGRGSEVENMDISTTVITREEIQKSPQLSIEQMLNRELGIWTSQIPANQTDFTAAVVGMRGFGNKGGEKVLVMVDGAPINDGIFRTIDWNQVPKDTIEKIEIIRGGGGATLWGNLAEGGVINIVTREPKPGEIRAGFAYGSFNTKVGDAAATLFHNDKVKVGLNLNAIESDGYNTAPKELQVTPHLVATDTRTHNALLSSYFTPTDNAKFYVKFGGHELLQDHANFDVANNQWYKYDYRGGGQIKYSDTGSVNISSFYDYSQMNKQNGSLINIGGGAINVTNINTIRRAGSMATQKETMNYQSYGGSAYIQEQISGEWGTLKDIKLGIDVRGVDALDNNNLFSQKGITNNSFLSTRLNWEGQNLFEGIFAQATYSPTDTPLDITLGLRQDWWQSFSAKANNTFGLTTTNTRGTNVNTALKDQFFDQFNPRMGIKYSFENGIDIRAAAYRNFAAPGLNQLFRTFVSSGSATAGNPSLAPETNFGQEIGIDFTGKVVRTQFTLFHNQLDNYINSVTMCGGTSGVTCTAGIRNQFGLDSSINKINVNQNVGSAVMEGGEFFVEWQALDTLNLNASVIRTFAFVDSFNSQFAPLVAPSGKTPLLRTSRQLPDVPTLVLTLGGAWLIMPNLQFGWSIKSWPEYWSNTLQNDESQIQQGATTADLNLNYQASKEIELYVTAQNVSNATYIASNRDGSTTTIPAMGMPRNVLGGFRINF
ncbi:MAG: TonB-dependent receptor [Methylomonas sp.]